MNNNESATQQRNAASEIIISGHIWRAVWFLAWPTAINTFILTIYNIINRLFLGRLFNATDAQAAITIGGTALMVQFALTIGLSAGSSALVARSLGAQQYDEANEATRQSFILAALAGIVSGLPFIIFAVPIVTLIGAKGDVIPLAADYTAINAMFSIPVFLYFIAITVLRSAGDVRSSLYAGVVVIGLNIFLDWLLIFGVGPFPEMSVRGAAIATGSSRVAGSIIALWFIKRSVLRDSLSHMRPHLPWFGRILNIGWPASIMNLLWTTAAAGIIWILAQLPGHQATAAQAAYGVALTIESIAFMPGVAYSMAATPLVGQNLGAGKPERAAHSAWVAVGQAALIMSAMALIFLIFPRQLALYFNKEASVVPLIVSYLRINAISEPFLALNLVLRGALQGAGDTRIPAWVTFITNWAIRLPLAYLFAITLGYGAFGAWIAISGSTVLAGIMIAAWFKWGTWRNVRV